MSFQHPFGACDVTVSQGRRDHVVLVVHHSPGTPVEPDRESAPVVLGGVPQAVDEVAQQAALGAAVGEQVELSVAALLALLVGFILGGCSAHG